MIRAFACAGSIALFSGAAFGQSTEASPKFEIADVHVSAKSNTRFMRSSPPRDGRYEVKNASMVDLIRVAYGFDPDKVLGGPSWLEMDRFDVIAKLPADFTPDMQRPMLQSLLADRFKLVLHKDTRPLPTYALTKGKTVRMKEADSAADGTEQTGCKIQTASGPPAEGTIRLMTMNNGVATSINLGPGATVQYNCRNITMAAFAGELRGMFGAGAALGTNPVLDQTGLEGRWNFDVRWSMQIGGPMMANSGDRVTIFDAVDKQLGLKLEQRQVPTPVIVVDSVERTPSDNPPGVTEALPAIPVPTEFEVADVKPTDPEMRMGNFQMQPGGRLTVRGMAMRFLVNRAFNTNNNDQVLGLPKWADTERFDITAKAPTGAGAASSMFDMESVAPMIRSLLVDRFKMAYHTEERPLQAYTLVAAKPKMKKADPASRASCKNQMAPPGAPPGSRVLTCQNVTMAQFVDQLQNSGPGMNSPILDATGMEGGWDFALTFSQGFPMMVAGMAGPGRGGEGGGAGSGVGVASDPMGNVTIFEAVEKQLGLKLEQQKRPTQVFVIDHIEQKPTEN